MSRRCTRIAAVSLAGLACFVSLLASSARSENLSTLVGASLERAGDNRESIQKALDEVPEAHRAGMDFLVAYLPEPDLKSLTADFLLENVDYAYRAYDESPWKDQISEDEFLNNILPYVNITEERDH